MGQRLHIIVQYRYNTYSKFMTFFPQAYMCRLHNDIEIPTQTQSGATRKNRRAHTRKSGSFPQFLDEESMVHGGLVTGAITFYAWTLNT